MGPKGVRKQVATEAGFRWVSRNKDTKPPWALSQGLSPGGPQSPAPYP